MNPKLEQDIRQRASKLIDLSGVLPVSQDEFSAAALDRQQLILEMDALRVLVTFLLEFGPEPQPSEFQLNLTPYQQMTFKMVEAAVKERKLQAQMAADMEAQKTATLEDPAGELITKGPTPPSSGWDDVDTYGPSA